MKVERGAKRAVTPLEAAAKSPESSHQWVALSSADFIVPAVHVELLLAFQEAPPVGALEAGLRQVLCRYREWAGRMQLAAPGRPAIELTDAGAAFMEARADVPLHHLLPFHPSPTLRDLIPPHFGAPELLLVQVTTFACGGMAVGIAWSHRVADGAAMCDFLNAWALTTRGWPIPPFYCSSQDRSTLMPRVPPHPMYDHLEFESAPSTTTTTTNPELVVKRLHFSVELLKEIKARAAMDASNDEVYTTFESLMGHLWRCITIAREEGGDTITRLTVAVDARRRLVDPAMERGYFGNVICLACANAEAGRLTREPLSYAVGLLHEAIATVNDAYVRSALDYVEMKERRPFEGGRTDGAVLTPHLSVTTWAKLPLYELDFGTGAPLFAGNAFVPFEGLLIITPSPQQQYGSLDVSLALFAPAMHTLHSLYRSVSF